MPSLLGRFSSTSTNFFQYIADNRKKLVDRNRSMYGSTKLNSRVSRRRNITNQMKNIINSLIVNIRSACPIETGNAKMNGIGYKVFNRHQAVVTVGSPSAPYVVYLNRSSARYKRGAHKGKRLNSWIISGVNRAEMEIYTMYPDVRISIEEEGSVVIITIYIPPEEDD